MVVVLPTIFIIYSIINRIVMPLRNIQSILRKMATGEIKTNILLEQDTHDEIGEITQDFNKIVNNLENIARELNIDLEKEKKALHETILRFHAIFNQSSQNIWIMDLDGRLLEANDSFYRTMGVKKRQILNRYFWDLPFLSKRKRRIKEIKDAVRRATQNRSSRLEINIRDIYKKVYVIDMTIQPVLDRDSVVVLIIGEGRDITERKKVELELDIYRSHLEEMIESRTEELKEAQKELLIKEKFAALGKLTAIVSHEIRNPLATIRSSAYLIKEKTKNKELKIENTIKRLERNVSRCDQIIEELLDYSRTPTLTFKPVKLDDWLNVIVKNYSFSEDITVNTSFNADAFVSIDTENFRRVIINLLANANQAFSDYDNSEKDYKITIKTSATDGFVRIIITDNGPGITDDIINKIFEPLFSTKSFGVGLGLPIVQQIVNQHSGTINVRSKPENGAEFTIRLPVSEDSKNDK
jgi:PAS domain S-box-containing protein